MANHRRRARTQAGLATALANELACASGEDDDGSVDAALVRDALGRLNDRDRELLTLDAWEDLTPAEIAVVLRRPAGVVRVQLHRARNRLRDELGADPGMAVRASTSTGGIRS
ncbi:sigma-70 family RNA polymerase sigma factor [Patulibacter sp. NPDC049589]|uniref:RNA polymerase sigma factor n=1 Tax=Patulibacter sp. NPDC049589 TaxID=3154731 RepID=UPI0034434B54